MRKLMNDKNANFDIIMPKEEESDRKNIKELKMYVENPKKWMKNHSLSKKGAFLLCLALYCMERRGNSCTIRVFFLKKRDLVFYLTILSTFYSLLKRSTWVLTLKV